MDWSESSDLNHGRRKATNSASDLALNGLSAFVYALGDCSELGVDQIILSLLNDEKFLVVKAILF